MSRILESSKPQKWEYLPPKVQVLFICTLFSSCSVFDFRHCCVLVGPHPSSQLHRRTQITAWRRLEDAEVVEGEGGGGEGLGEGEAVVVPAMVPSTGARKDEKGARQDLRVRGDDGCKALLSSMSWTAAGQ